LLNKQTSSIFQAKTSWNLHKKIYELSPLRRCP